MKLPTLPRICATLIFCLYSLSALAQADGFQKEYTRLTNELAKANKAQAIVLIPKIRALYLSVNAKRNGSKTKLDQNLKLYKETFSLLERMNPFDEESSDCLEKKVEPHEKDLKTYAGLAKNIGSLLDQSKIKAGFMGDVNKCGGGDCEAYMTGIVDLCSSSDCKAYLTGDVKKCGSSDCEAYVSGNIKECSSSDCKAYMSGDLKRANTDCKAVLTGNAEKCSSNDCEAYITGDVKKCSSSDCKAYLAFGGVSRFLKIKTHKQGFQKGSIPISVIYRRQQIQDEDAEDAANAALLDAAATSTISQ
jgi:hypothetical protein